MSNDWPSALAEHDAVLDEFIAALERVPEDRWHLEPAPGRWSAAALALHVADSYAYGARAVNGGTPMKMRRPPYKAWLLRTFVLPILLRKQRFPRGVRAPAEVRPDLDRAGALTRAQAIHLLREKATAARDAIRAAQDLRPQPRVTHAYFGALKPRLGLRLLSWHTRHHIAGMHERA